MHSEKTTRPQTLTPSRWPGSRVLETVHRLNARCLSLLAEGAQGRLEYRPLDAAAAHVPVRNRSRDCCLDPRAAARGPGPHSRPARRLCTPALAAEPEVLGHAADGRREHRRRGASAREALLRPASRGRVPQNSPLTSRLPQIRGSVLPSSQDSDSGSPRSYVSYILPACAGTWCRSLQKVICEPS